MALYTRIQKRTDWESRHKIWMLSAIAAFKHVPQNKVRIKSIFLYVVWNTSASRCYFIWKKKTTTEPDVMKNKKIRCPNHSFADVHLAFVCVCMCADKNFQASLAKKIFEEKVVSKRNVNMRNVQRVCSRVRNAVAQQQQRRKRESRKLDEHLQISHLSN